VTPARVDHDEEAVEKVLSETTNIDNEIMYRGVITVDRPECTVFYCDDSSVARKQIERTLVAMGVKGLAAVNGRQMWEEMEKVATYAQSIGKPASSIISLVLGSITGFFLGTSYGSQQKTAMLADRR